MCKKICANCKFYFEKRTKGLFGNTHKYWICDNPKTIYQNNQIWWADGEQITLGEGYIQELLVGSNFGCINFEENIDEC